MKAYVAYCQDIDCDGTSHCFTYFEGEKGTFEEFIQYELENKGSTYWDQVYEIYTLTTFFCKMESEWPWEDNWSREYFLETGYYSDFAGNMALLNRSDY